MNSDFFTSDSNQENIAPTEIDDTTSQETIINEETEATTKDPKHSIAEVVDKYIHKIRDIKYCSSNLIPLAQVLISKTYKYNMQKLDDGEKLIESDVEAEALYGRNQVEKAVREIERLLQSNIPETIESSLFLNLFATFDVFSGELIRALYTLQPSMFNALNRSIPLSEILISDSLDQLKQSVLDEEIEKFRRKSYSEQFDELKSIFKIELKSFEKWPNFIECAQRRNLMTHCGGVVSEQYIQNCKKEGYPANKLKKIGDTLTLDKAYLNESCELLIEVGLKLGQTLWRKIIPTELDKADEHLQDTLYDALLSQQWKRAVVFGEYAYSLKTYSNDFNRKILTVNYLIALREDGKSDILNGILAKIDWSSSINEFKLAEAVLSENKDKAFATMRRIGEAGELITEESYHVWPLFRSLREDKDFHNTYEEIYKRPFQIDIQKKIDEIREANEAINNSDESGA